MTIRILSIDGGGTRGLFPATILHQLENDLGKKATHILDVNIGSATGESIHTSQKASILNFINTP